LPGWSTPTRPTVLSLLYVVPIASDPQWQERVHRIGPTTAGLAIQATTRLDHLPIGPWAGLGVLAAYGATAMLLGAGCSWSATPEARVHTTTGATVTVTVP